MHARRVTLHAPLRVVASAADPVLAAPSPLGDVEVSKAATSIIQYAINFARVSETYETHSWMLLLGLLKQEDCRAAKILKDMGLDDLYGAWNEVGPTCMGTDRRRYRMG